MTDAELEEAKRLCDAATPGEWKTDESRVCDGNCGAPVVIMHNGKPYTEHHSGCLTVALAELGDAESDAAFIAALRQLVPRLITALESARRERDALAELLPKCAGTWDSGSGGHRKYLRDCDKPGVWDVGMAYVCDAHKNPNGGDADAWRWTEERDTLYSLRAAGGPVDALEMAVEGKLFAQALLSTARAEAEQLRRDWDNGVGELTKASYAQVSLVTNRLHETEAERDRLKVEAEQLRAERDAARESMSIRAAADGYEIGVLTAERNSLIYGNTVDAACAVRERETVEEIASYVAGYISRWADTSDENGPLIDELADSIKANAWRTTKRDASK